MYAIIEASGKQFKATPGDIINFDRMPGNNGDSVTFDKVLLVAGGKEDKILIGKPYLASAKCTGEIVKVDNKGEKLLTIKYIRRKQYRRTIGHRQTFTQVLVTKIEDGQGGVLEFDNSKRTAALMSASIKTAVKKTASKKSDASTKVATTKKTATKVSSKKKA